MYALNNFGDQPLHIACSEGQIEVTRLFVEEMGVSIDIRNPQDGSQPIHYACKYGSFAVAEWIVAKDTAMVHAPVQNGGQPLHVACYNGKSAIARWLLSMGSKPDSCNEGDDHPLHCACLNGHLEIAQLLVRAGAPLDARTKERWTPLGIARSQGHAELADWLAEGEPTRPVRCVSMRPVSGSLHPIILRRLGYIPHATAEAKGAQLEAAAAEKARLERATVIANAAADALLGEEEQDKKADGRGKKKKKKKKGQSPPNVPTVPSQPPAVTESPPSKPAISIVVAPAEMEVAEAAHAEAERAA